MILFVAFTVIVVTVVGQGLTLPGLIRQLRLVEEDDDEQSEEVRARLEAARAGKIATTATTSARSPISA